MDGVGWCLWCGLRVGILICCSRECFLDGFEFEDA
jgi:hypothetical protein